MIERLADLNKKIYNVHKEACKLRQEADMADFQYRATREGVSIEYKEKGLTELEAKAKAYADERVKTAHQKKLGLEYQYRIKQGLAEGLTRRWQDLHGQNKAAYGYEVREAVNS